MIRWFIGWCRTVRFAHQQKVNRIYFAQLVKLVGRTLPRVIEHGIRGRGAKYCYKNNPRLCPWSIANQIRNSFCGDSKQAVVFVSQNDNVLFRVVLHEVQHECQTYEHRLQEYGDA